MRIVRLLVAVAASLFMLMMQAALANEADHNHHDATEEVVVSAAFIKPLADTVLPVGVLSGEALHKVVGNSLGGSLNGQLGIHSASFGTGVGLPVIRGQSGTRVKVLQNSTGTLDVSTVSPDHAHGVDPNLAERIEVIRGPATLLYGNGALGGVVNVIDGRIPSRVFERPELVLEQSHATAGDEDKTLFKLNVSSGQLSFHLDYSLRSNNDVDIGGNSLDETLLARHDDDDHDANAGMGGAAGKMDMHEEEEPFSSHGYIANSDGETESGAAGISYITDWGFMGFAASRYESAYGLPPGSHSHDEDEDEAGHKMGEMHGHEEEGPAFIRLDPELTRYEVAAEVNLNGRWAETFKANLNFTDYQHREMEIEPDGGVLPGTLFSRKGYDGRFILSLPPLSGLYGLVGLQLSASELSAIGAEAFIPKTDDSSAALFLTERAERDNFTWELGVRVEQINLDPGSQCRESATTVSGSASLLYAMNDQLSLLASVSHSERAATAEERYSNIDASNCKPLAEDARIVHAATALAEVGNPSLEDEVSQNLELGLRRHSGAWTAEVNFYYNKARDYIYLQETKEGHAAYRADDATFYGMEGQVTVPLKRSERGDTNLKLKADLVRAEFDDGSNLPRVPPARYGLSFEHLASNWSVDASVVEVAKQSRTGLEETATGGYTKCSLYADYHWGLGHRAELLLFAKGDNLLDEEIRHHTSLLKAYAPAPGRSIQLGVRLTY